MAVHGPPGNEELYHWKYVRKYKKNGKWRYVYPNDKLGIKEAISTKITGSAYKQHANEVNESIKGLQTALDNAKTNESKKMIFSTIQNLTDVREFIDEQEKKSFYGIQNISIGDIVDWIKKKK